MSNPFEYVKDLMTKSECDDTVMERKDYNKFIINRALSFHSDLIFYSNFVNEYPDIDNKCHYVFKANNKNAIYLILDMYG